MHQLTGREPGALQGVCFPELLPPGAKLFYETQFAPALLMRRKLTEISFDLVCPDGTRVPTLVNAVLELGNGGEAPQILLVIFPAEQRRLYEKELLRSRKEFEQVAEVVRRSSDAILRLGADSTIQTWNDGAEQIFGLKAEQAIGSPLRDLFERDAEQALGPALSGLTRGREAALELTALHREGRRLALAVSLTPHMEAPGTMVSLSAIIRDITSRKLAERALLQNEKLASVGRLASSIAHEINNPLEAVTNLLYILESRVEGETRELVMTAQEELARVSQIATQTLRFHKQSSGRTKVDLGALCSSVLSLYRGRFESSGIATLNDSRNASRLLCFEGELRQVLVNLVSNAFDAMRAGGRLTLRIRDVILEPSGVSGVRITVADTGSGMNREALDRLFEPFFSTKGIGGTGLGLWITMDLVQKNEGRIKIRSNDTPGKSGTVAMLVFPHEPVAKRL